MIYKLLIDRRYRSGSCIPLSNYEALIVRVCEARHFKFDSLVLNTYVFYIEFRNKKYKFYILKIHYSGLLLNVNSNGGDLPSGLMCTQFDVKQFVKHGS